MRADARRFWFKVIALLTPLVAVYAAPTAILWWTGEFTSADVAADRYIRVEPSVRYAQTCTDDVRRFKLRLAASRPHDVLVLGGSSSGQIRSEFFTGSTFNAAASIGSLWHIEEFVRRLGENGQPDVLILGLHPYLLLGSWPTAGLRTGEFDLAPANVATIVRTCTGRIWGQLLSRELRIDALLDRNPAHIGMGPLLGYPGYRADGSLELTTDEPIPERFESRFAQIRAGSHWLPHGGPIDEGRLETLRDFLTYAAARDIHVVGYLPQNAGAVVDSMRVRGEQYRYVLEAAETLGPLFASFGFVLFDATDVRTLGASDVEMIDGTHASETADLRLVLALAEQDERLAEFVDEARLRALLARAEPLRVF